MTAEAMSDALGQTPMTEEERRALLRDNSDQLLFHRAGVNLPAEIERRIASRQADREADRILRIHDSAGEPALRDSLLDFTGLMNLPDPRWLVGDLLPEVGLAFLAGQPGVFKSFFALHVAVGVATGTDVFGGKTLPGQVLYVAAEGAPGQKARVGAQVERLGGDVTVLSERFRLLARPIDLLNERHVDQLIEIIEERATRLVVVDTLARCTPGADENSATSMGVAVTALSRLKDAGDGRCVYVVHHSVKAPGGPPLRGSGAMNGAADTVHNITRGEGSPFVQVATAKQKDAEERAPFTLEFVQQGPSGLLTMSTNIAAAQHKIQAGGHRVDIVLSIVMSMDGPSMADLIEATGAARTTLTRDVADLISRGNVEARKVDGLTRYYPTQVQS